MTMKVTYIHHSGFFVELDHVGLLFDYYTGELPCRLGEKPVVVFASHRHGDHFSQEIFRQFPENREGEVRYVLSHDIREKFVPEEKRSRTLWVKSHTVTELTVPWGKQGEAEKLEIETFRSTDEGVAFLVRCQGMTIYHAGDLNNWFWNGEPDSWNHNMAANYGKELGRIKESMGGQPVDVAFVPLDPRLEDKFCLGLDQFMKTVGAKEVFPMHCWDDYDVIRRLKEMTCSEDYRDRVAEIKKDGDSFEI